MKLKLRFMEWGKRDIGSSVKDCLCINSIFDFFKTAAMQYMELKKDPLVVNTIFC